ncbi:unnamed protein product [Albugo candida]|uniref:Amino acid transporter transmembrane domain-containing protein n=1 Tax=Albugo candida TaxID=65357 RepID=A0A024GE66_9STRA|nr:unnamed protein product [Albugo candida]|eukprot:CCI44954.1 unnamed protein product [Albugo candida]
MADNVWDLHKALRGITARRDTDPGGRISDGQKALDLAVPGGFRRHHQRSVKRHTSQPVDTIDTAPIVSSKLRQQILARIDQVYDPFIGNMLSQDNDSYDELTFKERVENLLETPKLHHPLHRRFGRISTSTLAETSRLLDIEEEIDGLETENSGKIQATKSYQTRTNTSSTSTIERSGKTSTLSHALLTLLKSFVGTGVLFLPEGFKSGGILFSPICLTVIAAFTLYAMVRLLQCRELVGGTYGHIGYLAFGNWGRRMVQISILLMQAGFCCTYVIFVAKNMAQVFAYFGWNVSTSALILSQVAIYIPLSWIRYISYFSISNLIADVFILYGLAFILGNCLSVLIVDGPKPVEYFNTSSYPVFIGTAVFTFEGIGLVLPTQSSLSPERQAQFVSLLVGTVSGLLVFYSIFSSLNYLAFGQRIQPMVTSSLPRNGWSISVQFGYSIAQALSYPLFLFPVVKITEEMMGFPKRASGLKRTKNMLRALIVVITISVAYFGQTHLDLFVSIVGAFCCVPLSFIYPPLFYLKLVKDTSYFGRMLDMFVATSGILMFIFVTYSNLSAWKGTK